MVMDERGTVRNAEGYTGNLEEGLARTRSGLGNNRSISSRGKNLSGASRRSGWCRTIARWKPPVGDVARTMVGASAGWGERDGSGRCLSAGGVGEGTGEVAGEWWRARSAYWRQEKGHVFKTNSPIGGQWRTEGGEDGGRRTEGGGAERAEDGGRRAEGGGLEAGVIREVAAEGVEGRLGAELRNEGRVDAGGCSDVVVEHAAERQSGAF